MELEILSSTRAGFGDRYVQNVVGGYGSFVTALRFRRFVLSMRCTASSMSSGRYVEHVVVETLVGQVDLKLGREGHFVLQREVLHVGGRDDRRAFLLDGFWG